MSLVVAPTIIMAIDDTVDMSLVYSISEEEENKCSKEFEKYVVELNHELEDFLDFNKKDNLEYRFKTYPKPPLNLISPPPEFI
ncbi:hypothetical protein AB9K26_12595 [Psychroserpens sp. XS_ASV72]